MGSDVTSVCIKVTWAGSLKAFVPASVWDCQAEEHSVSFLPHMKGFLRFPAGECKKSLHPQRSKWLENGASMSMGELLDLKMFWNWLLKRRKQHSLFQEIGSHHHFIHPQILSLGYFVACTMCPLPMAATNPVCPQLQVRWDPWS